MGRLDADTCANLAARTPTVQERADSDVISVFVVTGGLQAGGTERHLSLILPRLRDHGFRPKVYAIGADGAMARPIRDAGIEIEFPLAGKALFAKLPRPFRGLAVYASSVLHLWRAIRREKPDICHCFLPMATVIGGLAARLAGHRLVIASRRSLRHYQSDHKALAFIERGLIRGMAAVLGNSRAVVEELVGEGVRRERIGLIYNGIAGSSVVKDSSASSLRQRLGIPDGAFVLLSVANLIPYKGHRDLLAALALVADDLPRPWVLLCAGRDDGIGAGLEREAGELGIRKNLRLLGEVEDVAALYRVADLSVLASHQEGFSNALVESMAAGLPVIATAVGGNGEAIGEDSAGRLVPPKDATALAAAIREIGGDAELRRRMGAAAGARVRDLFSLDACVDRYENLYKGMLDNPSRRIEVLIEER